MPAKADKPRNVKTAERYKLEGKCDLSDVLLIKALV